MMRLISWTGWTKEDWQEAIKFFVDTVGCFVVFVSLMFLAAFIG